MVKKQSAVSYQLSAISGQPSAISGQPSEISSQLSAISGQPSQRQSYLLQAFVDSPWAILPYKLAVLEEIVVRHISGEKLDAEEIQSRIHGAVRPPERQVKTVAVLPLFGTIFPRANMMTDVSGATSAERFGAMFSELVQNPEISAIVLDVDSPGGQVNGIDEVSKRIFDARGQKPIVAVANHTMASAAYWIGSAADEVVVTPSAEVGSIGVFAVHRDISGALAQNGIKISLISRGKYKVEGNPYEALTEEAKSAIEVRVGEAYDAFVEAIARNRETKPATVRNGFGEGRVVGARQAVDLRMADRIGTLEETITRLLNRSFSSGSAGAGQAQDVNHPRELESSASADVVIEHEAKRLRDYVEIFK